MQMQPKSWHNYHTLSSSSASADSQVVSLSCCTIVPRDLGLDFTSYTPAVFGCYVWGIYVLQM